MTSVDTLIQQAADGKRLSPSDGLRVYQEAEAGALQRAAHAARCRITDEGAVTFLVDRNINYTNACITDCKFCEFYRPPGHEEVYVLSRDVLRQKFSELRAAGGTRVLLQGGHHPDLRIEWYEELLSWMREEFPDIQRDAFSPPEIEHIALLEGMSFGDVLERLQAAGLDGIPGGGGEILDDEIRILVSPKKTRTKPWLGVMEEAHRLGMYTSASMVFGFGEEPRHRIASLVALRDQQDRSLEKYGRGFLAFVTWPLQYESRYGRVFHGLKGWKLGGTGDDYLHHIAFCRLFLDGIDHFQASWPTMGLDVAGQALHAGCDDMGGTMMEENVVSQAGSVHCSVSEHQVRHTIASAGFRPCKRNSWYQPVDAIGSSSPEA